MRYKDTIQCAGAELVGAVRADSRKQGLHGEYYALHIRRGDFQYKVIGKMDCLSVSYVTICLLIGGKA